MMFERIEVARVRPCGLEREVWVFTTHALPSLYLNVYAVQSRKTRRHKWRDGERYARIGGRREPGVILAEPCVPEDVIAEAVARVCSQIRFERWCRR